MPTGSRIRADNVFGTVTDNPLLVGATTMNSAGLVNLPAVASNHAVIVLDPLRSAGAPEIVIVTAHTASAGSATITRGAYGTTARQHASGVLWLHAPTIEDTIRIVTSGARPTDPYQGQLVYETDTDSYVARGAGAVWQTVAPLGAWTAYTPTFTQGVTLTKTVNRAAYTKIGRMVTVNWFLTSTGAGTAGQRVKVTLPVASNAVIGIPVGTGYFYDASATGIFAGVVEFDTTTTACIRTGNFTDYVGATGFALAVASGDIFIASATYEAAS